jgi:hypothetical protein
MRRPLTVSVIVAAVGVMASGCVIGNKVVAAPGGLMASCGAGVSNGVQREQLIEATDGFVRLERINMICADSGTARTLLKIEGEREGGSHAERTFVVRGDRLERLS